jgi:hypothetical protein
MRVFKVKFEWSYCSSDDQEKQAAHLKTINLRKDALASVGYFVSEEEMASQLRFGSMEVMLSESALLDLISLIPDEIDKVSLVKTGYTNNTFLSALESAMKRFEEMATGAEDDHDAMRNWDRRLGSYAGHNDHTNTHISNNVMTSFNQVMLMEDACTDALQNNLNDGWRIVAVCPQAARRPDYILGKFNPDVVSNPSCAPTSALRS